MVLNMHYVVPNTPLFNYMVTERPDSRDFVTPIRIKCPKYSEESLLIGFIIPPVEYDRKAIQ
jgi:hypothetical protein